MARRAHRITVLAKQLAPKLLELPVAPPAVRPSVKMDANQRSEDDLTYNIFYMFGFSNRTKSKTRWNFLKPLVPLSSREPLVPLEIGSHGIS